MANSVDSDETPCSAASHLGLYCLLRPVCPNTCGKYGNYKLSGYCPVTATFQMLEYRSDWPFTAVFLDISGYLYLTLCMLDNFACFFCHLRIFLTFQKKKSFRNTIRVSNSLAPDLARHFVGPDLGPDCLQRFPADDKCPQ